MTVSCCPPRTNWIWFWHFQASSRRDVLFTTFFSNFLSPNWDREESLELGPQGKLTKPNRVIFYPCPTLATLSITAYWHNWETAQPKWPSGVNQKFKLSCFGFRHGSSFLASMETMQKDSDKSQGSYLNITTSNEPSPECPNSQANPLSGRPRRREG